MLDPGRGTIVCDPERLQQIVWNLLSNAIKFTREGGSVRVFVARIDDRIEIVVQDTGAGISPEFLPYVFDRFRQEHSGSKRRYGGLGLGLAIVRHLVELHGGSVTASSEGEGRGATFRVELPVRAQTAVDVEDHRPQSAQRPQRSQWCTQAESRGSGRRKAAGQRPAADTGGACARRVATPAADHSRGSFASFAVDSCRNHPPPRQLYTEPWRWQAREPWKRRPTN